MNSLMQVANGFFLGVGVILAAAFMRAVLHMSVCGG